LEISQLRGHVAEVADSAVIALADLLATVDLLAIAILQMAWEEEMISVRG
jgi:hypothetical protein